MVLCEPVINTTNPKDTSHIIIKFEEYNKQHKDDQLTLTSYLNLIIVYYNYIFKYMELKETDPENPKLKEIHQTINKMEDYYLFGVFGNWINNPLFNPESKTNFI